jgi:hypothetical protein
MKGLVVNACSRTLRFYEELNRYRIWSRRTTIEAVHGNERILCLL